MAETEGLRHVAKLCPCCRGGHWCRYLEALRWEQAARELREHNWLVPLRSGRTPRA